jgi:hypothetical protein
MQVAMCRQGHKKTPDNVGWGNICLVCRRASKTKYNQQHREENSARERARWATNPERFREEDRRRRRDNPDHYKAIGQKTRLKHAETRRQGVYRWNREHPDHKRQLNHAYKAAKAGLSGRWTAQEWQDLLVHSHYQCVCCGVNQPLTADHVVQVMNITKELLPEPVGGGNSINNIQPLCLTCNASRKDRIGPYTCACGRKFTHEAGVEKIVPLEVHYANAG